MASQMPKVSECSVSDCAYNNGQECKALAITVGEEPDEPICETFFVSSTHGGVKDSVAGVGACRAAECEYNDGFECTASDISVGYLGDEPDCLTFEAR
ncbi:MAG: DUF1540 domain-containing protein [Desulfuromonadales bacterium]|jgi:hypothetical protein